MKTFINTVVYRLFGAQPYRTPGNIQPCGATKTQNPEQPPYPVWLNHIYNLRNNKEQ